MYDLRPVCCCVGPHSDRLIGVTSGSGGGVGWSFILGEEKCMRRSARVLALSQVQQCSVAVVGIPRQASVVSATTL